MKLKIKVTKEVLEATKMCGGSTHNCAVAYACRPIFPKCGVTFDYIRVNYSNFKNVKIILPRIAEDFICRFDDLSPEQRVNMQPIEFEVNVPEKVISSIGIDQVHEILKESTTLEEVTS